MFAGSGSRAAPSEVKRFRGENQAQRIGGVGYGVHAPDMVHAAGMQHHSAPKAKAPPRRGLLDGGAIQAR